MTVLGVSANSRLLALAVVREGTLLDYRIHLFKEKWSDAKAARIIGKLSACVKEYSVTSIALTIPYDHHSTSSTDALHAAIEDYCNQAKIWLSPYPADAFDCFCPEAKAKKKALRRALTERYPELYHIHDKELKNKNKYYYKLFEAIAAATILSTVVQIGGEVS